VTAVNPVERPPYRVVEQSADVSVEVEAADWAGLLAAATLALSDLVRPLGRFETWTNRRVSVRGAGREEVLGAWLAEVLSLFVTGGFLPAIAEVERADEVRAAGVLRGGCTDPLEDPPDRTPSATVPRGVHVTPGGDGRPWRARVSLSL
jgi:SHS2 domain-containing protein